MGRDAVQRASGTPIVLKPNLSMTHAKILLTLTLTHQTLTLTRTLTLVLNGITLTHLKRCQYTPLSERTPSVTVI